MNDMLCRASAGSNAPELGALLSTEFGLSGESVRTRQLLRCDDAERDARVNHEVCRQLGIASVVVMPVVRDDEVLGVFELFSGKTNAFGDRDLSAVQRLGHMVETAVQLADVTASLPERLRGEDSSDRLPQSLIADEQSLDDDILEVEADEPVVAAKQDSGVPAAAELSAAPIQSGKTVQQSLSTVVVPSTQNAGNEASRNQQPVTARSSEGSVLNAAAPLVGRDLASNVSTSGQVQDRVAKPAKPLLWSATVTASENSGEGDQSHVPPVLRGLRKCEACGFPISGGRVLCVECEEKKWRGQLRRPQPMPTGAIAASSPAPASPARSVAAQAQSARTTLAAVAAAPAAKPATSPAVPPSHFSQNAGEVGHPTPSNTNVAAPEKQAAVPEAAVSSLVQNAAPSFVFSGGLVDSPSWISANKYVIGALALVAALVTAFFLAR